jgi:hypothetical protein
MNITTNKNLKSDGNTLANVIWGIIVSVKLPINIRKAGSCGEVDRLFLYLTVKSIYNVPDLFSYVSVFCFLEQVKVPETSDNVEYVSHTAAVVMSAKRGKKLKSDVPMEERLDNLSLTKQETGSHEPPRSDSMAHLLMQVCIP